MAQWIVGAMATLLAASPAFAQTFNDVPPDYWAYDFIETLSDVGITGGCGGDNYCPGAPVTRAQMSVFLERSMRGSGYVPPPATGNVFLDVSAESFAASFIEQLYLDGITAGCGSRNFCPTAAVTREQMAVFLLRAKNGAGYSPPVATGLFADVPLSHWAVHWIEQLHREGITSGCGGGNFCPKATVSRAQMAVFLVRTFFTAPVAHAGPDQTVYKLANVTLDGSASYDANGDELSFSWFVDASPLLPPQLTNPSSAAPSFWASYPGTYVFSLIVSDGTFISPPDSVTVNVLNAAGPTPPGTGLVVQSYSNFFVFHEDTMTKYIDFSCGVGLSNIDRAPDGTLVGTTPSALYEINARTGACVMRGSTPEWIIRLAVSPTGQIYGVSFSQYDSAISPTGRARRLYKLSSTGAVESYVEISGATFYLNGIDFGPDGMLYGVGIANGGGWWVVSVDPNTGNTTLGWEIVPKPDGDIDIDAEGVLRAVSISDLVKFDLASHALLSKTAIPGFEPNASPLSPIVFIP